MMMFLLTNKNPLKIQVAKSILCCEYLLQPLNFFLIFLWWWNSISFGLSLDGLSEILGHHEVEHLDHPINFASPIKTKHGQQDEIYNRRIGWVRSNKLKEKDSLYSDIWCSEHTTSQGTSCCYRSSVHSRKIQMQRIWKQDINRILQTCPEIQHWSRVSGGKIRNVHWNLLWTTWISKTFSIWLLGAKRNIRAANVAISHRLLPTSWK